MSPEKLEYYRNLIKNPTEEYTRAVVSQLTENSIKRVRGTPLSPVALRKQRQRARKA